MVTQLIFKDQYVTPEELIETLKLHFDSLPCDQLYLPIVAFTSCDKDKNETVVYNGKKKEVAEILSVSFKQKSYDKCFTIKTIKRDKSKAN
ncbi:MAG: hypothetical protein JKY09_04680 [Crocinitomicaceae bacterium]|nr:hypothetical protein [Crocinitomicaceae bacterium]